MTAAAGPSTDGVDVAIVGAGPTGLMAAALLTRMGVRVRILDKSAGPAKESRAMVVQARSLELFLAMGIVEPFLDRGFIVNGARVVVDGREALDLAFDDIGRLDTPFAFPLMIPQSETEKILLDDLSGRGVAVEYGVTVTGLEQSGTGVSLTTGKDGRGTIQSAYAIGADGAHSIVRKALGLTFEGAAYPQDFLLADCAVEWPFAYDRLSIFLQGTSFAAYFPTRGERRGRIIAIGPKRGDPAAPLETQGSTEIALQTVQAVLRDVTGADVTLSDPTWTSSYRVHHRGVDRYGVGRVFVAGDAAHIHSPAGGQGMNTGLQDAANLAWKLAAVIKGTAPVALLDTYNAERWPVGRKLLERTDRMFAAMTSDRPLMAGIRNFALPVFGRTALRSRAVRARAFHFVSELGIRYRPGAFVADDPAPNGKIRSDALRAGARAPDARINRTSTVFDHLRPDRFTILAISAVALDERRIAEIAAGFDAMPAAVAGFHCTKVFVARSLIGRDPRLLQAESPEIFWAYRLSEDAPEAIFVIRPDGHIAFCSDRIDISSVRAFLARFSA